MRNKYPGICYRCKKKVKSGEGHFERDRLQRTWRIQHAECAILYRGTVKGNDNKLDEEIK